MHFECKVLEFPDRQRGRMQYASVISELASLTEQVRLVSVSAERNYGKHVYHSISRTIRDQIKLLYGPEKQEITAIFNRSGLSKSDFLSQVESILPRRDEPPFLRLPETMDGLETYETRNKADYENAIDYVEKRWGDFIRSGAMKLQDLNRLDPKAAPAVRSYCQRMALAFPKRAHEFVASDHLPQGRRQRTPDVEDTIEGTPARMVALQRAGSRERKARARAASHDPTP